MLRTWTDTHYTLAENDWLYIATHTEFGSCSLICPGSTRDGQGFSIHFTPAQIELLETLVQALRSIQIQTEAKHQPRSNQKQLLKYPIGSEK